ncbi:MAG TPA: M15 family metallopeptidase [Spirochaetota bacterium]|nr:M15 family metallopeptidase [Spirochaetota bacterium]
MIKLLNIFLLCCVVFLYNKSYYFNWNKAYIYRKPQVLYRFFKNKLPFLNKKKKTNFLKELYYLLNSYSTFIRAVDITRGKIYFIMEDYTRILYDNHIHSYREMLAHADIHSIFYQQYFTNKINIQLPRNYNPGRYRNEKFLESVYGHNLQEIKYNLVKINFFGRKVLFNKKNKAAFYLKKCRDELKEAVRKDRSLLRYLTNIKGTFNYRCIRHTKRLSAHAFGIAIDLDLSPPYYWKQYKFYKKKNNKISVYVYPDKIVRIFEKNYFIWGGKWYHFDTIHFEYRPEMFYNLTEK